MDGIDLIDLTRNRQDKVSMVIDIYPQSRQSKHSSNSPTPMLLNSKIKKLKIKRIGEN